MCRKLEVKDFSAFLLILYFVQGISGHHFGNTFDFIVVGGGTGGCAVASLLSKNGEHTVLLLHDGGYPNPELEVPAVAQDYWGDQENTTKHFVVNTGNNTNRYILGRPLGGTSAVNAMFLNRGNPRDYDNWANITGDKSWTYANMLKYLKRSETYMGDFPSDQHGDHGPITVTRPKFAPGLETWLSAGEALGHPTADANGPQKISFTPIEYAKKNGRRVSSFIGYLPKQIRRTRPNLRIIVKATATRVLFNKDNKATGVLYTIISNGTRVIKFARAHKEVVLSAGVIGSPLLLMRSGIGPESVLNEANIKAVKVLPGVGRNLRDHPNVFLDFILGNKSLAYSPERDLTPEARDQFESTGEGPYTTSYGSSGQAFMASSVAKQSEFPDWPDIHVFSMTDPRIIPSWLDRGAVLTENEVRIACLVFVARPKSSGFLTLNTTNLDGQPIINFQYLSNPLDKQVLIDGIRATLRIYEETPAFQSVKARYTPNPLESCGSTAFRSNEYWDCYLQKKIQSGFHGAGTCRMGAGAEDPDAVVDSKLRVIGVNGLRVVDASVMPQITNANPQGAIYGIAEKAAEQILKSWGESHRHGFK